MRMPVEMSDVTRAVNALKAVGKTPSISSVTQKIREMTNDTKAGSRPTITRMLAKIRNSTASAAIPGTEENVAIADHLARIHAYVHTASARVVEASGVLKTLRAELAVLQGKLEAALAQNVAYEQSLASLTTPEKPIGKQAEQDAENAAQADFGKQDSPDEASHAQGDLDKLASPDAPETGNIAQADAAVPATPRKKPGRPRKQVATSDEAAAAPADKVARAMKSPEQREMENAKRRERYAKDTAYREARLGHAHKSNEKKRKAQESTNS